MDVKKYLEDCYFGDRGSKAILIESWNKKVKIQIDMISRYPVPGQNWTWRENIEDGWLVFDGVDFFSLDNNGHLPNDYIDDIKVVEVQKENTFVVEASLGAVDASGSGHEVIVRIKCKGIHIEDPKRPGEIIQ
jgi:hypothetical protein